MRIIGLCCLALSLAAPLPAQQAAAPFTPQPAVTLPPDLDRVLRDYERLWRAGDAAGLAGIFTEDGFVPTRQGWVRGRAAIQATYANAAGDLRLRAHAFAVSDSTGYIIGSFRYGESERDNGKFVLALRRSRAGPWLIAADLDGPNR
jgi:ketosteroid isomerase-like protein